MPNQSQMTVELAAETLARLNELARIQNRSGPELIQEIVDGYLKDRAWFEAAIERGRQDLRAGRFVSQEEMEEKYRRLGVGVDVD